MTLTFNSPILGPPSVTLPRAVAWFRSQPHAGYSERDVCETLIPFYYATAMLAGVDPLVALAQLVWETTDEGPRPNQRGPFQSWWAQRPRRNPGGLGVNGMTRPAETLGLWRAPDDAAETVTFEGRTWHYNATAHRWEVGHAFAAWVDDAIPCHIARLVFYATDQAQETPGQRDLLQKAVRFMPLPPTLLRGSAPVLQKLGSGHNPPHYQSWAGNGRQGGLHYGQHLAETANRIAGQA